MDNSDEIRALTDERLTELLRRGEESAFNALADRYKPMTENAVKRFAPSFSEMDGESVWGEDDLRQCAALALYRAAMTYDPEKRGKDVRFGLYAKICVNNALISELRRAKSAVRRKRRRLEQEKAERKRNESSRRDPLEQAVSSESAETLAASIRSVLAPTERDVFDCYLKGMSVEQIAGTLGRDRKSVSNALYRMKVKIKGLLQNNL